VAILVSCGILVLCLIGMWSLLRPMKGRPQRSEQLTFNPGATLTWAEGTALRALDDVTIKLPGGLLGPDEFVEAVIETDGDVECEPSEDGAAFASISVRLEPGQALTLRRTTPAVVLAADNRPRRFEVIP
jgi:hypothetical protein